MDTRIFPKPVVLLALIAGLLAGAHVGRAQGGEDFKAARQLEKARELLTINEDERAVKMLTEIPRVYPKSEVRFECYMELGKYYESKNQNSLAIKQYAQVMNSENDVLIAEALYETGKNYYLMNMYNQAFSSLRTVTTNYPNSVFANQAYYYIGMCHFSKNNWTKAIDNLRMVGTAVSQEDEASRYTEGGQRFFVKIHDKDLVVLAADGKGFTIEVSTSRGDKEKMSLSVLDKQGEYYIGSLPTAPGAPSAGNGTLEVAGGDHIVTSYVDSNTSEGERMVKRDFETQVVSTATVSVTDGSLRNLMQGAFLAGPTFLKISDLDRDISGEPDKVQVKLTVMYVEKSEDSQDGGPRRGYSLDEDEIKIRDTITLELSEVDADTLQAAGHTGIFSNSIELVAVDAATAPDLEDDILHARAGDTLRVEYDDELHIDGDDPQTRSYDARVVDSNLNPLQSRTYTVNDADMKAQKLLLEAKALKELADIFKNVGLHTKSKQKGNEGLEKLQEVQINQKKIAHEYMEEALKVQWEIYLVMDDLNNAIATCKKLMVFAPDSTLVDQAMLQIGQATLGKGDYDQAIRIFNSILGLPNSDQKPLAAFSIGEAYEKMAEEKANKTYLTNAMKAYQSCAERYPTSIYAGQSLERVAGFYMKMQDYGRAVQLMENIEIDFPDIRNEKMLLMWGIALYRLGRFPESLDRMEQLVQEFPDTPEATKCIGFIDIIKRKIGAAGEQATTP